MVDGRRTVAHAFAVAATLVVGACGSTSGAHIGAGRPTDSTATDTAQTGTSEATTTPSVNTPTGKAGRPEPPPASQPRQESTASTTAQPVGSGSTSPTAGCPSGWTLGICPLPAPVGGSTFDAKIRAAIDKESDGLTSTAFRVTAPSSDKLVWEMAVERQPLSRGMPSCLEDGTALAKVASQHRLSFRGDPRARFCTGTNEVDTAHGRAEHEQEVSWAEHGERWIARLLGGAEYVNVGGGHFTGGPTINEAQFLAAVRAWPLA
jgi:hypothetical protein